MLPIPAFNPGDTVAYPNGNGVINVGAADAGAKMLLYNESPFNINIDFLNGSQSILHAWEARYWTLDGDTRQVEWDINSTLNVTSSPISLVIGELYTATERLEGTYPMGLIRQTNVGNVGGVATTTTNQVINDGNTLQQVIEATLSGHTSSDVIINNDGSVTFKGAVLLAAIGLLTHILGNLTIDGTTTQTGAVTATNTGNNILLGTGVNIQAAGLGFASGGDTLQITTAGARRDTHLQAGTGAGSAGWFEAESTQVASWDVNAALRCKSSKPIVFNFGSMGAIGFKAFTGLGTGTAIVLTHNFGFVPDVALWSGGHAANTNPGDATASVYNWQANNCTLNNFASVDGCLLYIKA